MPLDAPSARPANFAVDRDSHTIRFVRSLHGAPAQVFDAWTRPEQISLWWDPNGRPLARCEIDLRVGGKFLFSQDGHHPFGGTYVEIFPPHRLVFDAMGSRGTVTLTATADGTEMVVTIACQSAEQLEQFIQVGVAEGTSQTLDNLVSYLR